MASKFWSYFGFGKNAANNPADDRYYEPQAPQTGAGVKITADSLLKCDVGWRCVMLISDILSTADKGIYQYKIDGDPNSGMDPVPNHPVDDLIADQPNPRHTAAQFWGTMVMNALLRGTAYAEIKPGPRGVVDRLMPIDPKLIQKVDILEDDTLRLTLSNPKGVGSRVLLQEELFWFSGLSSDGIVGLSTIDYAAEGVALLLAADQYAARVFSQNLNMGGFISHPGKLSKEGGDRLVTRLQQRFAGVGNFFRPMILQEGMEYKTASMTAQEAQLLEARRNQVRVIANYFGVPLHLLGIDDQTNRATVEEQWKSFVRSRLKPLAVNIEQAIKRDLIVAKKRYVAKFDLDDIERGNMEAVGNYVSKMLGSGGSPAVLSQNEIRVWLGWNTKTDDPDYDKLAKGTNPSQDGAAPAAKPAADEEAKLDPGKIKLFRKEVKALRQLALKHVADAAIFRKAVTAFYGGFASEVAEKLGRSKEEARAWCKARADRVGGANDINAAIDAIEAELDAAAAP